MRIGPLPSRIPSCAPECYILSSDINLSGISFDTKLPMHFILFLFNFCQAKLQSGDHGDSDDEFEENCLLQWLSKCSNIQTLEYIFNPTLKYVYSVLS